MAVEDEVGFILDDPLDDFPLGELFFYPHGRGGAQAVFFMA